MNKSRLLTLLYASTCMLLFSGVAPCTEDHAHDHDEHAGHDHGHTESEEIHDEHLHAEPVEEAVAADVHADHHHDEHAGHDHAAENDDEHLHAEPVEEAVVTDVHAGHDHSEADSHAEHNEHEHLHAEPVEEAVATDVHAGHDHSEADGHAEHAGPDVRVSDQLIGKLKIVWQPASRGAIDSWLEAPGEISIPENRIAHIVPRVKGVVRKVTASLGEHVKKGQVLAVIDSRELADAKAYYMAALERRNLAESSFKREETLYERKISAEEEFLSAGQALAEAKIQTRVARQKLIALGLSSAIIDQLHTHTDDTLTSYEIKAPFDGSIVKKHIVLGEVVDDSSDIFVLADLSVLNVDLNVNSRDIMNAEKGQLSEILVDNTLPWIRSRINYVEPVIKRSTRSAIVRMELDNSDGHYRPGTFVSGRIQTDRINDILVVPAQAVQMVDDKPCVFTKTEGGFEKNDVTIGRRNRSHVEITSGLNEGDNVVVENAFHLKAELTKQAGAGCSGHSH